MLNASLYEVLTRLVRTPGTPGDLDSTLRHIVQRAQEAFATDVCVILAFNPITGNFRGSQYVGDLRSQSRAVYDRPRPEGVSQQVLSKDLILVENLEEHPEYQNRFTREEGFCSLVGIALRTRHRKRPLGVIYLDFREPRTFTYADQQDFRIFAIQAALLLQEAWLAHHYDQIARIGQEVNQNLATPEDLFQVLQKYVDSILDDNHMLLLAIYNPQLNTVDISQRSNGKVTYTTRPLEGGEGGACKYVIEEQETFFIRQLSKEQAQLPFKVINLTETEEKESLIFVPLISRDVSLGVLSIQHPLPEAYGQEDLFVLQLMASYLSLALHNMRLYNSLGQLHETGQLLTQQLESEQTLQLTVDRIREATKADVVILYPYDPMRRYFILPPRFSGVLYESFPNTMDRGLSDDIAAKVLALTKPLFARESATFFYQALDGNLRGRKENFQQRERIRSTAILPLRGGDELVGALFVNFRHPQRFDATQRQLIDGLAHFAAIAIKNAQDYGSLIQRRVRELEILQHIDRELNRTLDLESVLNTLLHLALQHVPGEEASILLYDPNTNILETAAAIGRHAETSKRQTIYLRESRGITHSVVEHKTPIRIDNLHHNPFWRDIHVAVAEDITSELDVPLLDGDEVIGVMNFESTKEAAFSHADQDFLVTLAGQAVLAIKNAQAYEREKRLVAEAQGLNDISREIISQLDQTHVFDVILEQALELTKASAGNLMLYDPERKDLWMAADQGVIKEKKGQRQSLSQGIVGYVARRKEVININLLQQPWSDLNLDFIPGTRFELAVPMLAGSNLIGVLNVESSSQTGFTESDKNLLMGFADMAVIAVQNAQAYEREKRLAAESQGINEISKQIISQLEPKEVFDLILEKALELTRSTLGSLHLFDRELNELKMVADQGVADEKKGLHQKLDEGVVGYAARHKQLQNIGEVTDPSWNEIYVEFFPGVRSELAVPMMAGDELHGVLNVESPSPNNFSKEHERLLKSLADLAIVAVQNAELYKKAEQEAQRFELLYKAGQELGKIADWTQIEQAYEMVVQIAAQQSQSQVVIYLYDEMNAELMLCYATHRQAVLFESIKLNEGINGQAARERRMIIVDDRDNLPAGISPIKRSDLRMRSFIIIPIQFKDQYYGNLGLRHEEVGHFRSTDIPFFEWLAQQLASTIYRLETAQARQEFEQRAISSEEMSSIGQSAFEVTHRLGNDLGLIHTYINTIRAEMEVQGVANSVIDRKLEQIHQSVQAVLSFSRDLKDELANLGVKEEMAGEPVAISPRVLLLEAAAASFLPSNVKMDLAIDEDLAKVNAIPGLVADILRNLIDNAIQAMPKGGTITLRARNAGRHMALDVIDTGVGIAPDKLSSIFGLFFSTKRSSGFGLWSARRNALRNHGDLKVESIVGLGTTFTLLLPRTNGRIP